MQTSFSSKETPSSSAGAILRVSLRPRYSEDCPAAKRLRLVGSGGMETWSTVRGTAILICDAAFLGSLTKKLDVAVPISCDANNSPESKNLKLSSLGPQALQCSHLAKQNE